MDTWITIEQGDVLASINNAELEAALNAALAAGQENPLATLIPDVTAEVRGYVRRRNTLGPSGTLPQELKNAAIDIIIYRTANRLRKKAIAEDKKADTDQALRKLAGVAEGRLAVSAPDNPATEVTSAPGPRVERARREFGPEEERGV
jgi:phage gp36-like protein